MKKVVILSIIIVVSIVLVYLGYRFLYPSDLKELSAHLEENEKLIKEHQELYNNIYLVKEKKEYEAKVVELNDKEANMGETVKNLDITFVGDSIMLGAVREMGKMFPNSYSDALTSRSLYNGLSIVEGLKNEGKLSKIVVLNLGANGDCYNGCKEKFMDNMDDDTQVFWLTVTDDYKVNINGNLKAMAEKYDNLHIIDWETLSAGHEDWFYADGIHLPYTGQVAYTEVIYEALLDYYKNEFGKIKENELNELVLKQKNGLEVYGNDLFINVFDLIKDDYPDMKINSNSKYKAKDVINDVKSNGDKIKNNVLLAFDSSSNLKKQDYQTIINELGDRKIYVISLNSDLTKDINSLEKDNVKVLELALDEKSYLTDRKHLGSDANKELASVIKDNFKLEEVK